MPLSDTLFAIVAGVTAASAIGVVAERRIVRSVVWLLFTLIGISLNYFLLGAEFLGAAQLIIYVGGVLVLVVFGIMLTAQGPLDSLRTRPLEWVVGCTLGAVLFALLVMANSVNVGVPEDRETLPGTGTLGLAFLGFSETANRADITGTNLPRTPVSYLLPFEIVSVHLLVVLIGAAYLARAKKKRILPAA